MLELCYEWILQHSLKKQLNFANYTVFYKQLDF